MPLNLPLLLVAITASILIASTIDASSYLDRQPYPRSELELVQLVFRNGERTPFPGESYPTDPYANSSSYETWGGAGRLTDLGRRRARRLGLVLRRRYSAAFPGLRMLASSDVYAYSLDRESCKESLRMLLDGLCGRQCAEGTRVRSVPEEIDVLMNSRSCSRYRGEMDKLRRSAEVQRRLDKYEGLYRYITEKTGVTFESVSTDERLFGLHNLLEAQRSLNLSLPSWCPEGVLNLLSELSFLHYNLESHSPELRRLNGGPLLRRFLDAMQTTTGQLSAAKIHLYSGAGHNVAAFARALGKSFPRVPSYGSAILLEKRRERDTGRLFVQTIIWTGASEKLFPMRLRGCPEMCPIGEYARIVKEALPDDGEIRCLLDDLRDAGTGRRRD